MPNMSVSRIQPKIFFSANSNIEASAENPSANPTSKAQLFSDLTKEQDTALETEKANQQASNPNKMLTNLFLGEIIAGLMLYLLSLGASPLGRLFRRA